MFIRYQVHVQQPISRCRQVLQESPEQWLPTSVRSESDERRFLSRVGFGPHRARLTKGVEIVVSPAVPQGDWLVIPIRWHATGPSDLFPALDGALTIEPLGPRTSRLSLSGTYHVPLGGVGKQLDAAVMHNVAEATIKDFVDAVASRVAALAGRVGV